MIHVLVLFFQYDGNRYDEITERIRDIIFWYTENDWVFHERKTCSIWEEDCDWHTVWTPFNGVYNRTGGDGTFLEFTHMVTGYVRTLVHDGETWVFANVDGHTMTKRGEGNPPYPANMHDWLWTDGETFEWYYEVPIVCQRVMTPIPSFAPSVTPTIMPSASPTSDMPSKVPSVIPTASPTSTVPSISP